MRAQLAKATGLLVGRRYHLWGCLALGFAGIVFSMVMGAQPARANSCNCTAAHNLAVYYCNVVQGADVFLLDFQCPVDGDDYLFTCSNANSFEFDCGTFNPS